MIQTLLKKLDFKIIIMAHLRNECDHCFGLGGDRFWVWECDQFFLLGATINLFFNLKKENP